MPAAQIELPNQATIPLIYVKPHGGTESSYYNGIRRGWIKPDSALIQEYIGLLPWLTTSLVDDLATTPFDTIAMSPSSRTDALPFMSEMAQGSRHHAQLCEGHRKSR